MIDYLKKRKWLKKKTAMELGVPRHQMEWRNGVLYFRDGRPVPGVELVKKPESAPTRLYRNS